MTTETDTTYSNVSEDENYVTPLETMNLETPDSDETRGFIRRLSDLIRVSFHAFAATPVATSTPTDSPSSSPNVESNASLAEPTTELFSVSCIC